MHVERELQELRERLAQVEEWKRRREEINRELESVWVEGSDDKPLEPPPYVEVEKEAGAEVEKVDSQ